MSAMADARAIARQREARLQALLEVAAAHSPVYRTRLADAPAGVAGFARLAPIGKAELMAHFDDWVTDPGIRFDEVMSFIADPRRIGEQFLGRYTVWTSSGSTASPGVFVQDARALLLSDTAVPTIWTTVNSWPMKLFPFVLIAVIGFVGIRYFKSRSKYFAEDI